MDHIKICVLAVILGTAGVSFGADRDLGQLLSYKLKASGKPAFGVVYAYGIDPDGPSYLFTFDPKVLPSEGAKRLRWNYYLRTTDSFLLEWSADHKIQLAVMQVSVGDSKPELKETVNRMLLGQRKVAEKNELYFVLADDNNIPQYNVPISDLCEKHPGHFHDMTYEKRCDEILP